MKKNMEQKMEARKEENLVEEEEIEQLNVDIQL